MASISTNKRRRTAANTLHISYLPIGFIVGVSTYLSKPSRAILAVAFSGPSSSWQNDYELHRLSPIGTAIISAQQWDILDFEDVDKELTSKLTDDDINAILKSISARDMLKKLKLCGCINITGIGLNPLRGSIVLEQIDFSLVRKYEKPNVKPKPKISDEVVVPILDSIISADGCSLKHIIFPWKWRVGREHNELLAQFIERYNAMFRTRSNSCSHCNINMRDHQDWMGRGNLHSYICYDCLKSFCSECSDETREVDATLKFCGICEKDYCQSCIPILECVGCHNNICKGCEDMKTCDECGDTNCKMCLNTCDSCNMNFCALNCYDNMCYCYGCKKMHCTDCYNGKEHDVRHCDKCDITSCISCNLDLIKDNGLECRACAPDTIPLMLDEIAKQKEELAQLRKENEELRESAK